MKKKSTTQQKKPSVDEKNSRLRRVEKTRACKKQVHCEASIASRTRSKNILHINVNQITKKKIEEQKKMNETNKSKIICVPLAVTTRSKTKLNENFSETTIKSSNKTQHKSDSHRGKQIVKPIVFVHDEIILGRIRGFCFWPAIVCIYYFQHA